MKKKKLLSPCCRATISGSLGDGVWIGSCSRCYENVTRLNPKTGVREWLDGESPWTSKELRSIEEVE